MTTVRSRRFPGPWHPRAVACDTACGTPAAAGLEPAAAPVLCARSLARGGCCTFPTSPALPALAMSHPAAIALMDAPTRPLARASLQGPEPLISAWHPCPPRFARSSCPSPPAHELQLPAPLLCPVPARSRCLPAPRVSQTAQHA